MLELILVCLIIVSFFAGGVVGDRRQIQYRQRWKEALALLDEEKTKTLLGAGEEQPQAPVLSGARDRSLLKGGKTKAQRELEAKSGSWRDDMEATRLRSGMAPIDTLEGLSSSWYASMVKRRYRYGYDEEGQKVR